MEWNNLGGYLMPNDPLPNPEDVVMFNLELKRAYYYKHNPFKRWQNTFSKFCRQGREHMRTNNRTKVYPEDFDHYTHFKAAAYFDKKPKDNNGWHIIYYPALAGKRPHWIAITSEDVDYSDWCDWCKEQGAVGAALNADYLVYVEKEKKQPGRKKLLTTD